MTSGDIALQNSSLAERFNNALKKLEQDKDAMEKIRDRNLWQKIFSNNTRDLARAGISQTEVISELNAVVQDMMGLLQKCGENQASVMEELHACMMRQSAVDTDFRKKIISLAMESLSQSLRIKKIEVASEDQGKRIVSAEQIEKLCLDIREVAQKKELQPVDQFIRICNSVEKYLSASWLSFNDKRNIVLKIKECAFSDLASSDINRKREDLKSLLGRAIPDKSASTGIWENFLTGKSFIQEGEISMSDAVSGVIDAVSVPEGDRYTKYRDSLISLFSEFIDKGIDVDNEYIPKLVAGRKRLMEGQFEIALVGEFQGGKSTTFNTLCGGREISPRGLNGGGIKTSAAVITAQNISDGETKNGLGEWAEITWVTGEDVKKRIMDVLGIQKDQSVSGGEIASLLKKKWTADPSDEELDRLRIATLQWRLLSSANFEKYRAKTIVGINEFQNLVKFPKDWEPRWEKHFDADFTLEECLFTCIDNVLVRIKSPALARLGCRITDCPGLFVSQWDTEKALSVMARANAIWYLLSGDKQIGGGEKSGGDKKALQRIKDNGWQDKCFLSLNRRKGKSITEALIKTNLSILKGYGFDPNKLFKYNALLSYRLAQLKRHAAQTLSEKDLECLAIEAKPDAVVSEVLQDYSREPRNVHKALRRLIAKLLGNMDEDDLGDEVRAADEISDEILAKLYNEAGINEISANIEKLIVASRARSILITHGTQECTKVLTALKARKELDIKNASISLEQAKVKAAEATAALDKFIAEWQERFGFLKIDSFDHDLTRDFFAVHGDELRNEITSRAIVICKEEWHGDHWINSSVNSATERRIKDEFLNLIRDKLNFYLEGIKGNSVFRERIFDKLVAYMEQLGSEWSELKEGAGLLEGLSIPTIDTIEDIEFSSFNSNIDGKIDVPWYSWELLKDIITLGIRRFFQTTDDRIENFFKEEDPVGRAYKEFRGDPKNEKKIALFLGIPRKIYDEKLSTQFDAMRERLKGNIAAQENSVKRSNAEREQAAQEADQLLRDVINPYMEKITLFENEVRRFYAE